jgi:hypothetical protein
MSDNSGDLGSFLAGMVVWRFNGAAAALYWRPIREERRNDQEKSIEPVIKPLNPPMRPANAEHFAQQAQEAGDFKTGTKQALRMYQGTKPLWKYSRRKPQRRPDFIC